MILADFYLQQIGAQLLAYPPPLAAETEQLELIGFQPAHLPSFTK